MNSINFTLKAEVSANSPFSDVSTYLAEGYDVFNVTIPAGSTVKEVDLVTTGAVISLFAIKADAYNEGAGNTLSYRMHASDGTSRTLDRAQMFTGSGMVAMFGVVLDKAYFANSGAVDRIVTIVIGRDVTP